MLLAREVTAEALALPFIMFVSVVVRRLLLRWIDWTMGARVVFPIVVSIMGSRVLTITTNTAAVSLIVAALVA